LPHGRRIHSCGPPPGGVQVPSDRRAPRSCRSNSRRVTTKVCYKRSARGTRCEQQTRTNNRARAARLGRCSRQPHAPCSRRAGICPAYSSSARLLTVATGVSVKRSCLIRGSKVWVMRPSHKRPRIALNSRLRRFRNRLTCGPALKHAAIGRRSLDGRQRVAGSNARAKWVSSAAPQLGGSRLGP
jgi:hypothetical protein